MTVKVLIIDPDISFTVAIKRALETTGDYKVSIFASGKAALELLRRDSHDVAILDYGIDDISLEGLIDQIRRIQPWIFLIASPHSGENLESAATLDIQGTITKPYVARQLVPVIRSAAESLTRQSRNPSARIQELAHLEDIQTPLINEPLPQPDDTFRQAISTGDTTRMLAVGTGDHEPPIPDDATVRQLVSGQTTPLPAQSAAESATPPDLPPEGESLEKHETAVVAEMALEIAHDDTVPLNAINEAFAERVETIPPEDRPTWIPALDPDQPTLVGPALTVPKVPDEPHFVASIDEETVQYEFPLAAPILAPEESTTPRLNLDEVFADLNQPSELDLEAQTDEEMALTFAGLLPPEERPHIDLSDEERAHITALSMLGLETVDELDASETSEDVKSAPAEVVEALPMHTVAELLDAPPPLPADSDPVATAALQLTQLAVNSSAQVSLLSRGEGLIAMAGLLPEKDVSVLVEEVNRAWHPQPNEAPNADTNPARFRYIQLPNGSDYLMYSIRTVGDMLLTMLFPGDVPLKHIRKQARELADTLVKVPTAPEPDETFDPAETTLLSRPTELRPPPELREALAATEPPPPAALPEVPPEPPPPPIVYVAYGFMWLPRHASLAPESVGMVGEWIAAVAGERGWRVDGMDIQPAYVTVQLSIPAAENASAAVEALIQATAQHADNPALWAEVYYITPSGRTITQREILEFAEYCREFQTAP